MKSRFLFIEGWGDAVNPIVVKELRQGLRSNVFVGAFLLLQMLLLTWMIAVLPSVTVNQNEYWVGFDVWFWIILAIPLAVMVFSSQGAIHEEIKGKTLELMYLTPLSAWRIVLGKWIAVLAQGVLMLSTVFPYWMLRYYFGGTALDQDVKVLGLILVASAFFAALTVGRSAYGSSSKVVSWIMVGLSVYLLQIFSYSMGSLFSGGMDWRLAGHLVVMLILAGLLSLELGAARIAPPAENHTTLKRVIGLVALGYGAWAFRTVKGDAAQVMIMVISWGLWLPVCIGAINEPLRFIPSVFRSFVRRGRVGQAARLYFSPGWSSGVFYALMMLAIAMAVTPWGGVVTSGARFGTAYIVGWLASLVGTFFSPRVLLLWFPWKPAKEKPLRYYWVIQAVLVMPGVVYLVTSPLGVSWADTVLGWSGLFPASFLLIGIVGASMPYGMSGAGGSSMVAFAAWLSVAVSSGVTLEAVRQAWCTRRDITRLEEAARLQLQS